MQEILADGEDVQLLDDDGNVIDLDQVDDHTFWKILGSKGALFIQQSFELDVESPLHNLFSSDEGELQSIEFVEATRTSPMNIKQFSSNTTTNTRNNTILETLKSNLISNSINNSSTTTEMKYKKKKENSKQKIMEHAKMYTHGAK